MLLQLFLASTGNLYIIFTQLDYKVGWKKLKEVFGMAGTVVRTDILEDKEGKSRGMGTVTFDIPIEAVQAVCILLKTVGFWCEADVLTVKCYVFLAPFMYFP